MVPRKYTLALVILITLAILTLYFYDVESSYVEDLSVTSGSVSAINYRKGAGSGSSSSTRIKTVVVSFSVESKNYKVNSRGFATPTFSKLIEVYYDPDNPTKARINRIDEVYLYTLTMLFFLVGGILSAIMTHFLTPYVRKLHQID